MRRWLGFGVGAAALVAAAAPAAMEAPPARAASFEGDQLALSDGTTLRRARLGTLLRGQPRWETVADVMALGAAERRDWRLQRSACLPPVYRRCLFFLTEAGKAGVALREYDTAARTFVAGGFDMPAGPHDAAWYDDNRIIIAADTGPGTVTAAGAPRLVKLWTRGTPAYAGTTILAAPFEAARVRPIFSLSGGGLFHAAEITRANGVRELYHFGWAQNFRRSMLPGKAQLHDFFQGRAVARVDEPWIDAGPGFSAGSVVAYPMAPLLGPGSQTLPEFAYAPPAGFAVVDARAGRDTLYVHLRGAGGDRLMAVRKGAPDWPATAVAVPGDGPMRLLAASDLADVALIERGGDRLFVVGRGRAREIRR